MGKTFDEVKKVLQNIQNEQKLVTVLGSAFLVPKWVNWCFIDDNGGLYGSSKKPVLDKEYSFF